MKIRWVAGDAHLPSLGLSVAEGEVVDVPASDARSLISQGKATKAGPATAAAKKAAAKKAAAKKAAEDETREGSD